MLYWFRKQRICVLIDSSSLVPLLLNFALLGRCPFQMSLEMESVT